MEKTDLNDLMFAHLLYAICYLVSNPIINEISIVCKVISYYLHEIPDFRHLREIAFEKIDKEMWMTKRIAKENELDRLVHVLLDRRKSPATFLVIDRSISIAFAMVQQPTLRSCALVSFCSFYNRYMAIVWYTSIFAPTDRSHETGDFIQSSLLVQLHVGMRSAHVRLNGSFIHLNHGRATSDAEFPSRLVRSNRN